MVKSIIIKITAKCSPIILHFIVAHYDNKSEIILILITRTAATGKSTTTTSIVSRKHSPGGWVAAYPKTLSSIGAPTAGTTTAAGEALQPRDFPQKMADNGNVRN